MNVLDLFCGAGGFSLGFKNAGFNIIGGVDFDEYTIETHKLNFPNGEHCFGDISEITDEEIIDKYGGRTDVIIGGPPCQGFSVANLTQTDIEKAEKNKLFYEFIRFVKLLKPKAFVMENVPPILSRDKGLVKKVMLETMSDLGYNVEVEKILASDYGVPQKRKRVFFVGLDKSLNTYFDFDLMEQSEKVIVDDVFELETCPKSTYQEKMRSNSNNELHNHNIRYPSDIVQERISHVPPGGNWRDISEYLRKTLRKYMHSNVYHRLDKDDISITMTDNHGGIFHPVFDRYPSVRETARIQSFPDDFVFVGSQTSQYTQVGNAVPPLVSYELAKILKTYFGEN